MTHYEARASGADTDPYSDMSKYILLQRLVAWLSHYEAQASGTDTDPYSDRQWHVQVHPSPGTCIVTWILQNSLNSSGHGNIAQSVLRDLTCARKTFPTPLHHCHQPVPLTPAQDGAMDSCCLRQILAPNPDPCSCSISMMDSSD